MLDRLHATTRDALLAAGARLQVREGDFLVRDGDESRAVFVVESGLLKIVKSSFGGRVSFLGLRRPGTIVGELGVLSPAPRSSSLLAVVDSTVTRLDAATFEQLLRRHDDLALALLGDLADRLREASAQIHDLIGADATTRVAARLLQLIDEDVGITRTPGEPTALRLALPISQQELGEWAGLSRAGVVKALRALRDRGLIETSRMSIAIIDAEALRAVALV